MAAARTHARRRRRRSSSTRTTPTARATATAATRTTCWPARRPFGRIVTPGHAALRHPPDLHAAPARSAASCPGVTARRRAVPAHASGPTSSRRRSGSRPRSSGPIVNTRDEPHCDAQKYRRLHVIVGDANMSEVATYLKVGTTAIVLAMIEDDELGDDLAARATRCRRSARSATTPRCQRTIVLRDGRTVDRARGAVGAARTGPQVRPRRTASTRVGERGRRRRARAVGGGAHRARDRPDARRPTGSTGWPSTGSSTATRERHDLDWDDARLKAIDLQYHDLRPEQSPARCGSGSRRIVDRRRGRARR